MFRFRHRELLRSWFALLVLAMTLLATAVPPTSAATVTTLASFQFDRGRHPQAGLIADAAGNLYGTAEFGGTFGGGSIFRISDTGFVVVPEPASLVTFAIACLALAPKRRRQRGA